MMTAGAWQVRVAVSGDQGDGTLSVPVPTLPKATLAMTPGLGAGLFALMLVLCAGFVAIVSGIAREAGLEPGQTADRARRRRGRIAGAIATAAVAAIVALGNAWWTVEATAYAGYVYKPLEAQTQITSDGRLTIQLHDPGWLRTRRLDDFVDDHGHPMHLFIVSPALDRLWHLHPTLRSTATFEQYLPPMPAGRYELFGDLVHRTGISETVTTSFDTAGVDGSPLSGDDSQWPTSPSDGRIVWEQAGQPLQAKRLNVFSFRVEHADGRPADDMELYMGMPGHAVFIRRDRTVFSHVHPGGSAPMAALALASPAETVGHAGHATRLPPVVTFPYGFPEAGDYRIFVQVKRSGRTETAVFDASVAPPAPAD
jgi:hypothetical protein